MDQFKPVGREMRWLRSELDRLLGQANRGTPWAAVYGQTVFHPPTDVYETEDALVVKVEIAGMQEDDFRIALVEQTLIVAGVRRDTAAKRGYHQMEIGWGPFQTEVGVNMTVRDDEIEAHYDHGFLTIQLPKARSRRIPVHEISEESR